MKASKYNAAAFGHGKWFVALGRNPEAYRYGPHDNRAEAEEEADDLLEECGREVATIGIGEEVVLHLPDASEVIETICDNLYDQCGEASVDYLGRRQVSVEQEAELTAAIEKAVAEWMDRHHLWPDFCTVEEVGTVTRDKGGST